MPSKSLQLYLTLWTIACQTIHGILQAGILEWVAMPSSKGSSRPRNQTCLMFPALAGRSLPLAPPGKPEVIPKEVQES